MFSRFHWHIGTFWSNTVKKTKPNVSFVPKVHTPIAESTNYEVTQYLEKKPSDKRETIEFLKIKIKLTNVMLPLFKISLISAKYLFKDLPNSYNSLIVDTKIPPKYHFTESSLQGIVVIGPFEDKHKQVIKTIKEELT